MFDQDKINKAMAAALGFSSVMALVKQHEPAEDIFHDEDNPYPIVEGKHLKIRIPEGATHYRDETHSNNGCLMFFKFTGEGDGKRIFVWGHDPERKVGHLIWSEADHNVRRGPYCPLYKD